MGGIASGKGKGIRWARIPAHHRILLVIIIFHVTVNFLVVSFDRTPLTFDESDYLGLSFRHLDAIRQGDLGGLLRSLRGAYPPAAQLLAVPLYPLLGTSPDTAIFGVILASAVLIVSIYHIGKELYGKETGLLAAALTSLLPGIFAFSRTYYQEIPLAATVALSIALMLKTDHFSRRWRIFAFGLSLSLGALTRWSFSVFVIGPFCVYALQSVRKIRCSSQKSWMECLRRGGWLLLMIGAGLVPAVIWYVQNLHHIIARLLIITQQDTHPLISFGSWRLLSSDNLLYYLQPLYRFQLRIVFLGGILISLLYLVHSKKLVNWRTLLLGLWFLIPYIFFTFAIRLHKSVLYTIPYLGAIALLTAIGAVEMPRRVRRWFVAFLLIGGLLQMFLLTFSSNPFDPRLRHSYGLLRPDQQAWDIENLTRILNENLAGRDDPSVLLIYSLLYSETTLNSMQRAGELVHFRIGEVWIWHNYSCLSCGNSEEVYLEFIEQADIVLLGTGGFTSSLDDILDYNRARNAMDSSMDSFQHRGRIEFQPVPSDELRLDIYVRKSTAPKKKVTSWPVPAEQRELNYVFDT